RLLRLSSLLSLFINSSAPTPLLHPFPTRRSSDLHRRSGGGGQYHDGEGGLVSDEGVILESSIGGQVQKAKSATRQAVGPDRIPLDRKSTRLNSSHGSISYAVFCLKKKNNK